MCDSVEDYGLISVIIPVYNVEPYLRQCVDSVLSQTYKNIEIILVDDGSTDSSNIICDEYARKHGNIKVIHKKNAGLSEARNSGLDVSNGSYIAFIDSDDWISKDNLEKMITEIKTQDSDFVFSDGVSFEDSDRGYSIKQGYTRKEKYETDTGINMFKRLHNCKDFHCAVQMYLWKKTFLDKHSLRFYPGILYEDMLFTYKAFLLADSVAHCYDKLYHRRFRAGSIVTSRPISKNFLSAKTVYEEVSELTSGLISECFQEYCSRCAFRAIELYKKLSGSDKTQLRAEYISIKETIKNREYHNNPALKTMLHGKPFWLVYKAKNKVLNCH